MEQLGRRGAYRVVRTDEVTLADGRKIPPRIEFWTAAELLNIGAEYATNKNSVSGKQFIINTCKIESPTGQPLVRTALCYEGNYNTELRKDEKNKDPMQVGKHYLTIIRVDENGDPVLQMSHLHNANQATANDFAALYAEFGLKIPASAIHVEGQQEEVEKTAADAAAAMQGAPTGG